MADDESKLTRDFSIKGIAASEFDSVRGTMCTKDEFGGWGKNLSTRPYTLDDGRGPIGSKAEAASYVEATVIRDQHLCVHGYVNTACPFRRPNEIVCRVAVTDAKPMF